MIGILKIVLSVLMILAAVQFIAYAARVERVRVIEIEEDFTLRYPSVYRLLCVVFYLLVLVLTLNMVVWQTAPPLALVLTIVLAVVGLPFLLLSVVWKIKVRQKYIIYVGMFGAKRQIHYKDITRAVLTRSALTLETTLKTYQFSPHVVYREYFLKRLHMNGIEVERYKS